MVVEPMMKCFAVCPRCHGCGSLDVIQKIEMHADGKNCTYWQDREVCRQCEGAGRLSTASEKREKCSR